MIHVDWKPDGKKLSGFATISVIAFGALGLWSYFRHSIIGISLSPEAANTVGVVLGAIALYSAICRFVAPQGMIPIYYTMTVISVPIGFVLSHIIMGLLFYGVFAPIALFFRLTGRDVLRRTLEPDAPTYWLTRPAETDVKRYFRQF